MAASLANDNLARKKDLGLCERGSTEVLVLRF